MFVEIVLSLFTGWMFGVTYTNFDTIRPYLVRFFPSLRKRGASIMPAIYAAPPGNVQPADQTCTLNDMQRILGKASTQPRTSAFDEQVAAYEREHNSKVVFINHGRKTSPLGVDLDFLGGGINTICTADARALLDILREIPNDMTIDLILHTTGGSMAATEVMVKALLAHEGRVRVHVPYYAESAGTFLALAGDCVYIGEGGWLTQVDPQMGYFSAATLLQYTAALGENKTWISDFVALGRVGAKKAMDRAIELMSQISIRRGRDNFLERVSKLFVTGDSNHDKPLTKDLLRDIPWIVFGVEKDIMKLYRAHCERRA